MRKMLIAMLLVCPLAWADSAAIINYGLSAGEITRDNARSLYLMKERRWNDGEKIILYQMPQSSSPHRTFVRDVLGMSCEQYAREWDRLVNAGLSSYVRTVTSQGDMLTRIAITPNGLGYIGSDYLVINSGGKDVKILRIVD